MTDRADFIAGLRELADYLEATPAMPIPEFGTNIQISATDYDGGDDKTYANVEAVAEATGLRVIAGPGEWRVSVAFPGGIDYFVLGIASERRKAWDALTSYSGAVTA